MDKNELLDTAAAFVAGSESNRVPESAALRPDLIGMAIYGKPLMGFARAQDPFFEDLRHPEAVGPHFRLPGEWLAGAETVISFFLPFTEKVVASNRAAPDDWPSSEWLHARIEGQTCVNKLCAHLVETLRRAGHRAVAPSLSPEFWSRAKPAGRLGDGRQVPGFTSNWSERHVALAAGLGTFGLSAGIITEKGTAGRLGSVATSLALPPDPRPYARHDEYCTHCGACVRRCFVGALSPGKPKDKAACSAVLDRVMERHRPYYGCGKCNVAVPCERGIPARRRMVSTGITIRNATENVRITGT